MKKSLILLFVISSFIFSQEGWIEIGPSDYPDDIGYSSILALSEDVILFSGNQNFYKTTDGGSSWSNTDLTGFGVFEGQLSNDKFDHLYMACLGGLLKSTDMGESWFRIDAGFDTNEFFGITHKDDILVLHCLSGYYRSTDFGASWLGSDKLLTGVKGEYIYSYSMSLSFYGFNRSSDYGVTWENVSDALIPVGLTSFGDSELLIMQNNADEPGPNALPAKLYYSGDNGDNWTPVEEFNDYNDVKLFNNNGEQFYASVTQENDVAKNGLFMSTGVNDEWRVIGFEGINDAITICINPEGSLFAAAKNRGLFKYIGQVVPVELVSFTGMLKNGKVHLSWSTSTEVNNLGFEVMESYDGSNFSKAGFVYGKGTTLNLTKYSFTCSPKHSGTVYYKLKQIDYDGSKNFSEVVEIASSPKRFDLQQNRPNPFNPETSISFNVAEQGKVKLTVYNLIGEEIAVLANESLGAGLHTVKFNGAALNSGIYFYQLEAGNSILTRKMILIK